jgi:hypothetical protein
MSHVFMQGAAGNYDFSPSRCFSAVMPLSQLHSTQVILDVRDHDPLELVTLITTVHPSHPAGL